MTVVIDILQESYYLLSKMAPYLLFGFFFAGVLHIFLRPEVIARHLGKSNFGAVVKASLFGIPLPLCSCGVIPAALSLRRQGASKGATLSFLISTPTTGIDSIFATFALLGGFFMAYRIVASFLAALFVGTLTNMYIYEPREEKQENDEKQCACCDDDTEHTHSLLEKCAGVFTYAFGTLMQDAAGWLIAGILIGGTISYLIPDEFIKAYIGEGWESICIMLIIGTPMYICSSGSIPIATALMLKGLNPGAAFAFLFARTTHNNDEH